MNVSDEAYRSRRTMMTHGDEFKRTFGIPIHKFYGKGVEWIMGFDIVAFDGWLGTPENVSTKQYVQIKYGIAAVRLIEKLIRA